MQIPEIILYWYGNLKRKWNERYGRERAEPNKLRVRAMPIGTMSEIQVQKGALSIALPHRETTDVMSMAFHGKEKCEESMNENFEKINKEIRKVVAKMSFFETKLQNMELSITNIEKTHYLGKF